MEDDVDDNNKDPVYRPSYGEEEVKEGEKEVDEGKQKQEGSHQKTVSVKKVKMTLKNWIRTLDNVNISKRSNADCNYERLHATL